MKLDFTRQTFSQTFFYSAVIMLIYWGVVFVGNKDVDVVSESSGIMPLGTWLNTLIFTYSQVGIIATILFQLFNALYISRIFIRNVIYAKSTYVASILFILISISSPITNQEFISQFVTTLSLLSIEMLLSVRKRINSSRNFFISSLLISIAGLLYLPASFLFVPTIALFFIYNRFNFRELLASFAGVLIPYFFYSYYQWITQNNFYLLIDNITAVAQSTFELISIKTILEINIYNIIFIGVIITGILFSLVNFIANIQTSRSRTIHSYSYFWAWTIVLVVVSLLFFNTMSMIAPLFAVSISIIVSFLFNESKHKLTTNIIFIAFLILSIMANIHEYINK